MNKPLSALAAVVAALSCTTAFAQGMPLRGVGLLALNASESGSVSGTMVDVPDGGGGGAVGARALRGGDAGLHASPSLRSSGDADNDTTPDALPSKASPVGDPSPPAAATPRRPSYRWQSLVPGAIK